MADECVKHLDRLADEAKNFEIPSFHSVYDYRSSPEWKTCCERIEEWVRKAADSEKTYGERLREWKSKPRRIGLPLTFKFTGCSERFVRFIAQLETARPCPISG